MATYQSPTYAGKLGAISEGLAKNLLRLHDAVLVPSNLGTGDVCYVGYLPGYAIVTGVAVRAPTQLDSNGAPTLTVNVGYGANANYAAAPQAFMAASAAIGRAAGSTSDNTMVSSGRLFKNAYRDKLPITITVQAAAATGVAGSLELDLTYFIEEPGAVAA